MSVKIYKAEIKMTDRTIKVEGPKDFVEEIVAKYSQASNEQAKLYETRYLSQSEISKSPNNERELIAEKHPHGHHEIVAVLAFALTEAGTGAFTEDDIRRAYIRAGVRPPKVIAQALRDAKNRYDYLAPAGGRGRYRLTNHGDRVVRFDLPRSTSN